MKFGFHPNFKILYTTLPLSRYQLILIMRWAIIHLAAKTAAIGALFLKRAWSAARCLSIIHSPVAGVWLIDT